MSIRLSVRAGMELRPASGLGGSRKCSGLPQGNPPSHLFPLRERRERGAQLAGTDQEKGPICGLLQHYPQTHTWDNKHRHRTAPQIRETTGHGLKDYQQWAQLKFDTISVEPASTG